MSKKKEARESLLRAKIDPYGREINNPVPLFVPGMKRIGIQERIQSLLQAELSKKADEEGFETWEEANDFDIDDLFDQDLPLTPYETVDEEFIKMADDTPRAEEIVQPRANDEAKNSIDQDGQDKTKDNSPPHPNGGGEFSG